MPRLRLAALVLVAALLVSASAASAHRWRAPVFGPDANPYGQSYGEWAVDWWTWVLAQPADVNPLTDLNGADCAQGQRGRVWFLAGTFFGNPPSASRTCTVPKGKALLFPVLNSFSGATKGDAPEKKTAAYQRTLVTPPMRAATGLHASIDGVSVRNIKARYFEESEVFKVVLPDDNILEVDRNCAEKTVIEAGCEIFPTVDAGYYLMVKPLRRGTHTIKFGGAGTNPDFTIDMTYTITVAGRHQRR